jgi:hypothetical protein
MMAPGNISSITPNSSSTSNITKKEGWRNKNNDSPMAIGPILVQKQKHQVRSFLYA